MRYSGIALVGQPGSGKTTVGAELAQLIGAKRLSFAKVLKEDLSAMLALQDSGVATEKSPDFWAAFQHHYDQQRHPTTKDAYRPLQQALGAFRRAQDVDYWVKRAMTGVNNQDFYVVDDCRYRNEYDALRNRHFAFLLLKPGPTTRPLTGAQAEHESERDWPHFPTDGQFEFVEGPAEMARIIAVACRLID